MTRTFDSVETDVGILPIERGASTCFGSADVVREHWNLRCRLRVSFLQCEPFQVGQEHASGDSRTAAAWIHIMGVVVESILAMWSKKRSAVATCLFVVLCSATEASRSATEVGQLFAKRGFTSNAGSLCPDAGDLHG